MITIGNKHHDSRGVYVGRPTILGNPYTLQAYTRTDAIASNSNFDFRRGLRLSSDTDFAKVKLSQAPRRQR